MRPLLLLFFACPALLLAQTERLEISGLEKPVEVIVDQWGIPPIYAQMEADLFLHRDGASFRMLINTGNWDHCLGTNNPGQAGDPEDPSYRNLFNLWATDQYFPVFHSREKVESIEVQRLILEGQ